MNESVKVNQVSSDANQSNISSGSNPNMDISGTVPFMPLGLQSTIERNNQIGDAKDGPISLRNTESKAFDIDGAIEADRIEQEKKTIKRNLMFRQIDLVLRNGMDSQQQLSASKAIRTIILSFED